VLLNVKNLRVVLPSGECVTDNLSFKLDDSQMVAIVGGSGAGKTTVCRAVMGILGVGYKTDGEIKYLGENLLTMPKDKLCGMYGNDICYIMQNPMTALNPSVRIGKQIEKTYLLHNRKVSKAEIGRLTETILRRLGLDDTRRILRSYPFGLSGGMLQRIMIAMALMNRPKLLVADEVETAIDACNRTELMRELKLLCSEGMSVLFVTHDLRSAANADEILIMNRGRLVESGKTEAIMSNPKEEYTKQLLGACRLERIVC
jgi:ABC-type dipeptide/oligopeptide/nickel transport system ATPase component